MRVRKDSADVGIPGCETSSEFGVDLSVSQIYFYLHRAMAPWLQSSVTSVATAPSPRDVQRETDSKLVPTAWTF